MHTLLITDDDDAFVAAASILLADEGYEVVQAGNVRDCLSVLRQTPIDLAIIDVFLPDGNGLDVADEIHRTRPELPLIMISSDHSEQTRSRCAEVQAEGFLPKPIEPQALLTKVSLALENR